MSYSNRSAEGASSAPSLVPELSIIIPVHNQWHLTRNCIASLLQFPPNIHFEIIVVDDGSTDETATLLTEYSSKDPRIRLISNQPPHRFATACNCGVRSARGELLLVMNNDIEATSPDWFEPLAAVLRQRPEVGIAVPRLLFPNGTIQHCGKLWSLAGDGLPLTEHYLYEQSAMLPESGISGEFLTVTGACLLLRREEFLRIGPFDESYENGWEDDDLCLAYKEQGLVAWVCADSTLIHHQGGTLKAEALVLERYLGVLTLKGIVLSTDDTLLAGLRQRTGEQAVRFERAYQNNRRLFSDKWLTSLQRHLVHDATARDASTVVIVTYNSANTIASCLESLVCAVRSGDRVVVIDNNSRDETCKIADGFLSKLSLQIVRNSKNLGFSAASNQGIRLAGTPYVVLLNPDTVVTTGWLDRMSVHCSGKDVAAVGPVSNFAAGRQSVAHHWHGKLPASISPESAAEFLQKHNCGSHEETKLLIGFCMMLRREVLMKLGGLDERLFLGNDDLEISWRFRLHGYRLLIATDTFIWHEGQHSFKTDPETTTGKLVQRSTDALYRILAAHYGPDRVPVPQELWGIDWFAPSKSVYNSRVWFSQVLSLPHSWEYPVSSGAYPLVSIIILTFNQWACTEECLASIKKHTPESHEVIVVDNGSSDGTRGHLQAMSAGDRRYRLVLNAENCGYAAGCNQGIRLARGEYVVLLNNDTVVTPEWLSGLLECHASHPRAGIVGPLTNSASGIQVLLEHDYEKAGGLDEFAWTFRIRNRFRRVRSRRIVGFCMFCKRSLLDEIGLLDEQFGTGNYEDDDICLRAAVAGYQNLVAADLYIHHHGSMSFKANKIDYRGALARNAALFYEKWSRPVTDPFLGRRISICRALEQGERLFLDEQVEQSIVLLRQAIAEYPDSQLLYDLQEMVEPGPQGERCRSLMLADKVAVEGADDYAAALVVKGFVLEPWQQELQSALLKLGQQGRTGLFVSVVEACQLYPDSRGLARLRVNLAALENSNYAPGWAEVFLARFGFDKQVLQAGLSLQRDCNLYHADATAGHSVSLCMIVKNEELNLSRCLASCKPVVHEIIVVDTGSTDATMQIAELFGAKLLTHQWENNFANARNQALEHASADWILVMDADEVLSARDYQVFKDVLESSQADQAYIMTTRNYTTTSGYEGLVPCRGEYPEAETGFGWTPSNKVRIFPNRKNIRFLGAIHEMVEDSLRQQGVAMRQHPVPVHHYGGMQQLQGLAKQECYLALGLKKLDESPEDAKSLYELAVQAAELQQFEVAEQLWIRLLDQHHDFAKGWFNLGYVLLRQGKLYESLDASERALALDYTCIDALVNKSICEACLYTGEEAQQLAVKAHETCPENLTLVALTALSLYRVGKIEEGRLKLNALKTAGLNCTQLFCGVAKLMDKQDANPDLAAVFQAIEDASPSAGKITTSTNFCS